MTVKAEKTKYTKRDHMIAYLVLLAVLAVIALGISTLYLTGIFDPVDVGPALVDTKPLDLSSTPEKKGSVFLNWLAPRASAEGAEDADPDELELDELDPNELDADELVLDAADREEIDLEDDSGEAQSDTALEEQAVDANGEPIISSEDELELLLSQIAQEERGDEEITEADVITVDRKELSANQNLPDDVYNVLLLATDSRDMKGLGGRSDVMIIASLNMTTDEIKLVSISRDLYVTIPGGSANKINAAYAYGGPYLAMKTVNEMFEMNIADYAVVNFHTMAALVDSIGGVNIHLEQMEYAYINYLVTLSEDVEGFARSTSRRVLNEADQETVVHLDGLQAVSYARIRKLDNDFQRSSRQRVLLQAIFDQGMSNFSFSTFMSLATTIMNSISTNVNLPTVIDVANWLLDAGSDISMQEMGVPISGSYHSATEGTMSVISFNQSVNTQALHDFLYGEYIPAATAAQ